MVSQLYHYQNNGWAAYLVPLHEQVSWEVKTALWILPIAVRFVLLISCANVATLLLVRASGAGDLRGPGFWNVDLSGTRPSGSASATACSSAAR